MNLTVNGECVAVRADPATPLLFVLRNELGLTGAKLGCGLEQCGACAVLVDGKSTLTCVAPASAFAGTSIVTVEGIADGVGSALQEAFIEERAAHCGYCTPGLLVAASALLLDDPAPDDAAIRAALAPHLCRCGSQPRVLRAVRRVAQAT